MSEAERAEAISAVQLELFNLQREYKSALKDFYNKRRVLKRKLRLVQANGMKRCRRCRVEMDIEQFYRDKQKSDGHDSYCTDCRLLRNKISKCLGEADRKENVISCGRRSEAA